MPAPATAAGMANRVQLTGVAADAGHAGRPAIGCCRQVGDRAVSASTLGRGQNQGVVDVALGGRQRPPVAGTVSDGQPSGPQAAAEAKVVGIWASSHGMSSRVLASEGLGSQQQQGAPLRMAAQISAAIGQACKTLGDQPGDHGGERPAAGQPDRGGGGEGGDDTGFEGTGRGGGRAEDQRRGH